MSRLWAFSFASRAAHQQDENWVVKVQQELPRAAEGQLDVALWAERLQTAHAHLDAAALVRVVDALAALPGEGWADPGGFVLQGMELASLLAELNQDQDAVLAGLIYRALRLEIVDAHSLEPSAGAAATGLAKAVLSLASASLLETSTSTLHDGVEDRQVENIRRMLIAMVDDPRVAVIKLAERVLAMRHAKHYDETRRIRIAQEAQSVFAPLASRLGIAQLKWELEDLALRYTEGEAYREIASHLRGKRAQRESQMHHIVDQVRGLLRGEGIDADVHGRAKHIYSIFRKMRSKGVDFDEVYDVRAVRVIVDSLAQCYATLGIVHRRWAHIPSEFDDYIANPKENGYQSIHTAVMLDDGGTLEFQIRTREMHEDAELGLCAHWAYKGGAGQDSRASASGAYDEKMEWLRQVLQWHDELGGTEDLSTLLRRRMRDDRIFVATPGGHLLDLLDGATVLDFAYRVHTDLGHACRGALVNGQAAMLDQRLATSQQVEIQSDGVPRPQRLWLEKPLAYVRSDRARAKIVAWFRAQAVAERIATGNDLLELAIQGLSLSMVSGEGPERLARACDYDDTEAALAALGVGELTFFDACQVLLGAQEEARRDYKIAIELQSENRDGLLLAISQRLVGLGLALSSVQGSVSPDASQAMFEVETQVSDWRMQVALLGHLSLHSHIKKVVIKTL